MFDWSAILKWLKPSPKYFLAVAFASGFLLFMPQKLLIEFQLGPFTVYYRDWISVIFISSSAILFSNFLFWFAKNGYKIVEKISLRYMSIRALKRLSSEEREILSNYIVHDTKSWNIQRQEGVSASLEEAEIIYQASNMGHIVEGFSFNLYPWIWNKLKKHPEILEPELSEMKKVLELTRKIDDQTRIH